MRALLIDAGNRTIEETQVENSEDIAALIGYDSIDSDDIDDDNTIYFDEECFIRGAAGKFQLDRLIPISGKAVITGSGGDGAITDVVLTKNELQDRIVYQD